MSNYRDIKAMYEKEKDPKKKAKLKEALECMEEAARNRGKNTASLLIFTGK